MGKRRKIALLKSCLLATIIFWALEPHGIAVDEFFADSVKLFDYRCRLEYLRAAKMTEKIKLSWTKIWLTINRNEEATKGMKIRKGVPDVFKNLTKVISIPSFDFSFSVLMTVTNCRLITILQHCAHFYLAFLFCVWHNLSLKLFSMKSLKYICRLNSVFERCQCTSCKREWKDAWWC